MQASPTRKIADPTAIRPPGFSEEAFRRLRAPAHRGAFFDDDAARRQLGLLTARNGQAKLYWLINMDGDVVQEAKYLAYGDVTSGPVADAFCELAKGKRFEDACAITTGEVAHCLRDNGEAAFGGGAPFAFLEELQAQLKEGRPAVRLLPKPLDVEHYTRKPLEEMNEADKAWLPLGLAKKLDMAEKILKTKVAQRMKLPPEQLEIMGLHDDLKVELEFHADIPAEQKPTYLKFAEEVFRSHLHPDINVKDVNA